MRDEVCANFLISRDVSFLCSVSKGSHAVSFKSLFIVESCYGCVKW